LTTHTLIFLGLFALNYGRHQRWHPLYLAVQDELSEVVELPQQRIRIECANLAAPWSQIAQRLLDLIFEPA